MLFIRICERHMRNSNSIKAVVFLTDVDGVFDQPPSRPGAKLIRNITVKTNGEVNVYSKYVHILYSFLRAV